MMKSDFMERVNRHLNGSRIRGRVFVGLLASVSLGTSAVYMRSDENSAAAFTVFAVIVLVLLVGAIPLNNAQRRSASVNGLRCPDCSKFLVPLKYSLTVLETGCCPHCGHLVLLDVTPR
jgi:hypothetical protein